MSKKKSSSPAVSRKLKKNEERDQTKEILEWEGKIKESVVHLNYIVNLLEVCESNDEKLQFFAIRATHRVFEHLLGIEDFAKILLEFKSTKKQKLDEDEDRAEFLSFLKLNYSNFFKILIAAISSPNQSSKITGLEIALSLTLLEVKTCIKNKSQYSNISYEYISTKIYTRLGPLMNQIIGIGKKEVFLLEKSKFLERVKSSFHPYFDMRYYLLKLLKNVIRQIQRDQTSKKNIEVITSNLFHVLKDFTNHKSDNESYFGVLLHSSQKQKRSHSNNNNNDDDNDGEINKKKRKRDDEKEVSIALNYSLYRKKFEEVYFELLDMKLAVKTLKQILLEFPNLLGNFNHPENTLDFLSSAYSLGSIFAILSLNSLFILITKYNLDFPQFYEKLYNLLDTSLFYTKYSNTYLEHCAKFFASKYIPNYLVYSFCKKLMRISLFAPPPTILPSFPLIYNIISSNPQMVDLLHRVTNCKKGSVLLVADDSNDEQGIDPFDYSQTNPFASGASESSFWELSALRSHYYQNLNRFCKVFEKPIPPRKKQYDLDDFLPESNGYFLEFATQSKKKTKSQAPLAIKAAPRLFNKEDGEFASWVV